MALRTAVYQPIFSYSPRFNMVMSKSNRDSIGSCREHINCPLSEVTMKLWQVSSVYSVKRLSVHEGCVFMDRQGKPRSGSTRSTPKQRQRLSGIMNDAIRPRYRAISRIESPMDSRRLVLDRNMTSRNI